MAVPYTLEYYGSSLGNTAVDITSHVITIDKFASAGTGEITSAKITLNASYGDFVT